MHMKTIPLSRKGLRSVDTVILHCPQEGILEAWLHLSVQTVRCYFYVWLDILVRKCHSGSKHVKLAASIEIRSEVKETAG